MFRSPARLRAAFLVPVLVVGALVVTTSPASAHAAFVSSDPADGATIDTVPEVAELVFNENLRLPAYAAITTPDGTVIESDELDVVGPSVLVDLAVVDEPGAYTLAYRVVSADGHPVEGEIGFTVSEPVVPEEPVAADPARDADDETTAVSAQESFMDRHGTHLLLGALVAVIAIAAIVWPIVRRRRASV